MRRLELLALALGALAACDVGGTWLDRAPTTPGVRLEPSAPVTGEALRVVVETASADPEGADVTYVYRWTKDGAPVEGLVGPEVEAGRIARGEAWGVEVVPRDNGQAGAPVRAQVTVANAPPRARAALDPSAPTRASGARARLEVEDLEADPVTVSARWTREGGAPVEGEAVEPGVLRKGERWTLEATPADPTDRGAPALVPFVVGNSGPSVAVTLEPAQPVAGRPLAAVVRDEDPDGDPLTRTYAWTVDGKPSDVTGDTVPAALVRRGQAWAVEVATTDGTDTARATASAPAARNGPPSLLAAEISPPYGDRTTAFACRPVGWLDADGDLEGATIEWLVDGAVAASGPTLPSESAPRGARVQCRATPFDGTDAGEAVLSAPVTIANAAPRLAGVILSPAAPMRGLPTTAAAVGAVDPDGDPVSIRWEWFLDGRAVPGLADAVLPPGLVTTGALLGAVGTPDDGLDRGAPVASALATVVNTPPAVGSIALDTAAPSRAAPLTARAVDVVDADGDAVTLAWSWTINGAPVPAVTGPTLPSELYRRGDLVAVTATPSDAQGRGARASLSVAIGNATPAIAAAAVVPAAGDITTTRRCEPSGRADPDADPANDAYAWTADGQPLANGPVLAAGLARRGQRLACTITPRDGLDAGAPVSSPESVVANARPVLETVSMSANPTRAAPVTAAAGLTRDADGDTVSVRWTWLVNGTPVGGSTGPTLTPDRFARGDAVTVRATAWDGLEEGTSASRTATVDNAPPSITGAAVAPAAGHAGTSFDCEAAGWSDADGDAAGYLYEWRVDGLVAHTGRTLPPGRARRGASIACTATPYDGLATGSARASSAVVLGDAPATLGAVVLTPASAGRRDTITAVAEGYVDADGDPQAGLAHRWFVNGVLVPAATGPTLAGAFRRGDLVVVEVTPASTRGPGTAQRSQPLLVANTPPAVEEAAIVPEVLTRGVVATAVARGVDDADGDPVFVRYEWSVRASGAPAATLAATGPTFDVANLRRGDVVSLAVTAGDGASSSVPRVVEATVANARPTAPQLASAPAQPRAGSALECSVSVPSADADGDAVAYAFSWTGPAGSVACTTSTATSCTLDGARVTPGLWSCRVEASDGVDATVATRALPRVTGCGDGTLEAGEACDDGNAVDTDTCTSRCQPATCGDGYIGPGEACDDGNLRDNDGCSARCVPTVAGEAPVTTYAGAAWRIADAAVAAGATAVTLTEAAGLAAGSEVVVHQAQHPTTPGRYELARVADVSGTRVTFTAPLARAYASSPTPGPRSAQLVAVVSGADVTVPAGAEWRAPAWDGAKGGLLAIRADRTLRIDGVVSAKGAGFRGGAPGLNGAGCAYPWPTVAGEPGESTLGTSSLLAPCSRQANLIGHLVPTPANGSGGGGGAGSNQANFSLRSGAGGGGGGHLLDGTAGAGSTNNAAGERGGAAGLRVNVASDPDVLVFGGGGGGGGRGVNGSGGWGGHGGGAVLLLAETLTGNGRIEAGGRSGDPGGISDDGSGGGGGGAGGTVRITATARAREGVGFVEVGGGAGGLRGSAAENAAIYGWPNYGTGGSGGAGAAGRVVTTAPETEVLAAWTACIPATPCATSGTQTSAVTIRTCVGASCNNAPGATLTRSCRTLLAGASCDDGNPATTGDACNGWGRCVGGAFASAASCVEPTPVNASCPSGMRLVPAGSFRMGREGGAAVERPSHWVTLSAFCIDTTEATVGNVRAVTPAPVASQPDPAAVPSLLFADAQAYCRARGAELPTEAQWEFAARGCDGRTMGASAFGLTNMLDRGVEWTADWLMSYDAAAVVDPASPPFGHNRVQRGDRLLSLRISAGPLDAGQLLPANLPRASVRCAAQVRLGASPTCGNGVLDAGEACDDGNLANNDGCTTACRAARCGDGFVQPGEACDDGNADDADGCLSTCTPASCGDGVVRTTYEACDDGNTTNGDGCSATCARESSARFTVSGDGLTVLDGTTGRTWQRPLSASAMAYAAAGPYCASLALGGSGWRLPTTPELRALVDTSYDPAIDPDAFPGTPADLFWTSTPGPLSETRMFVGFGYGGSYASSWDGSPYRVRCVR